MAHVVKDRAGNFLGYSTHPRDDLGRQTSQGLYAEPHQADAAADKFKRDKAKRGRRRRRHRIAIQTIREFAEKTWLKHFKRETKTAKQYRRQIAPLVEEFGDWYPWELDREDAREYVYEHSDAQRSTASSMFTDARAAGLCDDNPFYNLGIPRGSGRADWKRLTWEQVTALARTAYNVMSGEIAETLQAMILVAAEVGVRPGELFALQFDDIGTDLLTVERAVKGANEIGPTKTGKPREIPMPSCTRERMLALYRGDGNPFVFLTVDGNLFTTNNLRHYWHVIRDAAGMPGLHWYQFRHFCGSDMANRGLTQYEIAYQLGHTDNGALANRVYIRADERRMKESILSSFDRNIIGPPGEVSGDEPSSLVLEVARHVERLLGSDDPADVRRAMDMLVPAPA